MKPLLIAVAFTLLPASADAQVAAGTVPDPFQRQAASAPDEVSAREPLNSASERVLRNLIAGAQAGQMDYSVMTEDLGAKVKAQEAAVTPFLQGLGELQALEFVGSEDGADLFAVTFAEGATQWIIGFDDDDKVAVLLVRPA
jgi:hypothetical protein